MSGWERKRLVVLSQMRAGRLSLRRASRALGVGYQQVKRLWSRYQASGDWGLVHGLCGRKSNRRNAWTLRERVLRRYVKSHGDYGPTLAAESLAEEGIAVTVTTLRRWLIQAGLWQRRRRVPTALSITLVFVGENSRGKV